MQIAYRICKQMVFQTESPDRFSTSGKLYCTHRGSGELLRWPGVHRTEEVRLQLEHRDLRPEIQNKSFICDIGKGIRKPSFVDHSTCRIRHNMKNRVNISRRKITCFGTGQITGGFYCDILFWKALKSIKKMDFSVWKGCTDQGRKFTSKTPSSATFPGISNW